MRPTIGFVGVGMMGRALVERILAAGYEVVIFDVSEKACAPLRDRVRICRSPAQVGDHCDQIFGCLPTLASYRDAVLGPDGIVHGKRAHIYAHVGTTGAVLLRKLVPALIERGITPIDAPVTGGVARAREGKLTTMVAGPESAYRQTRPVFETYSGNIIYFGEVPGGGQTMKVVNNMLSAANLAMACQVLLVGAKAGLDADQMLAVINSGTGQNNATITKIPQHILPRTFKYEGWMSHLVKDLNAFIEEAEDIGVKSALSEAVRQCYLAVFEQGDGRPDYDVTEVIRPMERVAEFQLAGNKSEKTLGSKAI